MVIVLEAFDHAWNVSLSCGVCGQRGNSRRTHDPLHLTRRSAEGACDGSLVLVNSRTVFEGLCPCSPRVLQRRKYKGLAAQWREQCRSYPRSVLQVRTAPEQRREWWHSDRS